MGFDYDRYCYKRKGRWYKDGPLSEIEMCWADPDAPVYGGPNVFFDIDWYRSTFPENYAGPQHDYPKRLIRGAQIVGWNPTPPDADALAGQTLEGVGDFVCIEATIVWRAMSFRSFPAAPKQITGKIGFTPKTTAETHITYLLTAKIGTKNATKFQPKETYILHPKSHIGVNQLCQG